MLTFFSRPEPQFLRNVKQILCSLYKKAETKSKSNLSFDVVVIMLKNVDFWGVRVSLFLGISAAAASHCRARGQSGGTACEHVCAFR